MIANQEPKVISFSNLNLWSENPRQPRDGHFTNAEIIRLAIEDEDGKFNIQKLVDEFGEFVDFSEMPVVVPVEGSEKYLVLDGNRRLIFILALQDAGLRSLLFEKIDVPFDFSQIESMNSTWCNVCNMETAIETVYRKHANNGSWNQLERDYFLQNYKNNDKSIFIYLDEQSGIISADKSMNQRFVKEEVLTVGNLKQLGFEFDPKRGFTSNYNKDVASKIMNAVVNAVKEGNIGTRKNRGKLSEAIKGNYPDTAKLIKPFDSKKKVNLLDRIDFDKPKPIIKKKRKSKVSKGNDKLFGKNLILKEGQVNNAYMALDRMYERFKDDETTFLFFGAGLRLIVELAGRVYYVETDNKLHESDSILAPFMKEAKKNIKLEKSDLTYLSIVQNWLNGEGSKYEAILHKFAHGQVVAGKAELLTTSYVVGSILEHYHKR